MTNVLFSDGRTHSFYSVPTLGNPWTYIKQDWCYKVWKPIMACYMNFMTFSYALRYPNVNPYESLIQECGDNITHNPRVSLMSFTVISKLPYWEIFKTIKKLVLRTFLYLDPLTVPILWVSISHTFVTGKIMPPNICLERSWQLM